MAIRRPLMDVIDNGLDPRVAHSKLDKKGMLIGPVVHAAPVLAVENVKENLLTGEKKEVLTEGEGAEGEKPEAKLVAPAVKPVVPAKPEAKQPEVTKSDKTPKPV